MNLGGYSATGPREANEDNFYVLDFSDVDAFSNGVVCFALVSDGMGGYQGGDVASGIAIACAKSYMTQLLEMAQGNKVDLDAGAALAEISRNAHEAIVAERAKRGNVGMGATFVGVFASPTHAWIGHIGDSRCYLVREGEALQLTEDHSQVGRLLSHGVISEEEAQNHPARNRIERALGFSDGDADIDEIDLLPGDALLLCSDGVYTVLDAPTLGSCVMKARDAVSAAQRAVKLALSRGTDDNSTAVVVRNISSGSTERMEPLPEHEQTQRRVASSTAVPPAVHRSAAMQRAGEKDRAAWSSVAPLVLLVLLAGFMVFLFLRARGEVSLLGGGAERPAASQSAPSDGENDEASGEAPSQDGETQQTLGSELVSPPDETNETDARDTADASSQDDALQETDASTDGSSEHLDGVGGPQADEGGYANYTLQQATELKYVDFDGVAQSFSTEPWWFYQVPLLEAGATVRASVQTEEFGRTHSYRQLPDTYLEDLKAGLALYQSGHTVFDSDLSRCIGQEAYLDFLAALSEFGQGQLDIVVAHLIIDETSS